MPSPTSSNVLVIVESPTKARTIEKFLPRGYVVKASVGHVRDLPKSAADIPAKIKKLPWARLGVDIEHDFKPIYVVPKDKKSLVKEIRAAVRKADHIFFATDEDREGESISWHLLDLLGPGVPFERLVFHEITRDAIRKALREPRGINQDLVSAQETRRIVDRLFGYEVSPLLWKKMAPRLSAGRVQSVAVRLLVERERARIRFTEASYWGMKARFSKDGSEFGADLVRVAGRRIATGKDFDPDTGQLKVRGRRRGAPPMLLDADGARQVEAMARSSQAQVSSVEHKRFREAPKAPYVTSTLQQEANSKLRFQARHTMRLAQQLYENGFITYMRTDSTVLSGEAKAAARRLIKERFGEDYLSPTVRFYRNQVKNAQEAHEAIRPAGGMFRAVGEVRSRLGVEAARLYEMIWRRTLASQMRDARGTSSTVLIDAGDAQFRATGKTIAFAGYLRAYSNDAESGLAGVPLAERVLPQLDRGDEPALVSVDASERRTQAPQRFTEGLLIRALERRGIGRPSTWATIVDLVQSRSYAFRRGGALVPTFTAMAVVGLLEEHFSHLADYAFTAKLEDQLDAIARGELARLDYLKGFYFGNGHSGLQALIEKGQERIDPRKVCRLPVGRSADAEETEGTEVRIGRYGPFLTDGTSRCSIPDNLAPDELTATKAREMLDVARKGPQPLGHDPESGRPVYLRQGRFGPFVQLGDNAKDGDVKRASLMRGDVAEAIDLEAALKLLSLPRKLGSDPKTGADVLAANGRYGPYVKCGNENRSIPAGTSPFEITLKQALQLLAQEKKRGRRAQAEPLKVLGAHPETGRELKVLSGRYGPYVTDGEINASLPKAEAPKDVTMVRAVELLRARLERIRAAGGRKRRRRTRRS